MALIASAHAAIFSTDPAGIIRSWNPGSELLFGYSWEEAIGMPLSVLSPAGQEADEQRILEAALAGARIERFDTQQLRKGGDVVNVSLTMSCIHDQSDGVVGASIVAFDNTQRKANEVKLTEDLTRLKRTFETSPFGMAVIDRAGRFVDVNPALCGLLQTPADQLLATTFQTVTHTEDLRAEMTYVRQMLDGAIHSYHMEKRFLRPGGHMAWVKLSCSSVDAEQREPEFLLFQVEDIAGRKLAEKRLLHQALHDPLTDLPNRTLLMDRLAQALNRTARSHREVAVLFVDLDRFKLINDSLGHDAGDQLITAVAQRLAHVVRPSDTLARLGGDEFVIVCEDLQGERAALTLAERITKAVAEPVSLEGSEVHTTASIGIAVAKSADARPPILLANADAAMYRAKDQGGGRWELFDEDMRARLLTRLQTETGLRRALEHGELRLVYQPQVDLVTRQISGVEALVRWDDPERGEIPPGEFISVAEDCGLILPIGEWVLEEACMQASRWQQGRGESPVTVSVNVSAQQLANRGFGDRVADALKRADLPPEALCLEITETAVMDAATLSLPAWQAIQDMGIRIDVDDFGTGYSSLGLLKRMRVDLLKVDQSFVGGLRTSSEDSAIVEAVVRLAQALHLRAIAEGVETQEQASALRSLGCQFAQGYFFARPQPPEAIDELLGATA